MCPPPFPPPVYTNIMSGYTYCFMWCLQEEMCDEKNGWCVTDIQDKCRNILSCRLRGVITEDRPIEQYTEKHKIISKYDDG